MMKFWCLTLKYFNYTLIEARSSKYIYIKKIEYEC